jgi:translation initiation factor 3 subunit C
MYYVSAQFDTIKMIDDFMTKSTWSESHRALVRVLEVLATQPELKLGPIRSEDLAIAAAKTKKEKKIEAQTKKAQETAAAATKDGTEESTAKDEAAAVGAEAIDLSIDENDPNMLRVPGDLGSFVERLSQDFTKSLQHTDANSAEYIERLNNEAKYLDLAKLVQAYYERHGETTLASRMALLRISHMYYKHDTVALRLHQSAASIAVFGRPQFRHPACMGPTVSALEPSKVTAETLPGLGDASKTHPGASIGPARAPAPPLDTASDLTRLAKFVFKHGDAEAGDFAKASLCQVYYHALHDRYHKARDLLLMSHISEAPASFSIEVQILYNRTIAQVGLCAFRCGLYTKAKDCLSEICGRNKQKELLAQGINYFRGRGVERDVNAERAEKRRQMPYHHHINLEMIEVFQLTAAMIHEVPWMAAPPSRFGRWRVSPNFQRLMDNSERQVFNGPPETPKEHIYAAVRALRDGDWRMCSKFIFSLDRIWALVPTAKEVQADLLVAIKKAALRTFLFSFSTHYDSMSLGELVREFELDETMVHAIGMWFGRVFGLGFFLDWPFVSRKNKDKKREIM